MSKRGRGFPDGSAVKNLPAMQEAWVQSLGLEDPLEKGMATHSGSSQCTSPKHPVSCIEPGLETRFIHNIIHASMPFSQIFPPYPSPTEFSQLFVLSLQL